MRSRVPRSSGAIAASVVLLLVAACADPSTAPPESGPPSLARRAASAGLAKTDRHVILLRQGASADVRAEVQTLGGRLVREHRAIGVAVATGLSGAAAARLAARPGVEGVARDVRLQFLPPLRRLGVRRAEPRAETDQSGAQFFPIQWNLQVVQADDAWLTTNQGAGALVCILDTGIDPTHLDLAGKVDLSVSTSFVPNEPFIEDLNGHGTTVAGIVSTNGIGMASVAPDARLCAVKVLDESGTGSFEWVIAGIMHAADVGADVMNISSGIYISRQEEGVKELTRALHRAIVYASQRDALVVTSAGNDGANLNDDGQLIHIPSELNQAISVGATAPIAQQNFDLVASYSNFGKQGVDLFAPGGDLVTGGVVLDLVLAPCSSFITDPAFADCADGITYLLVAGTSAAAPHVAGAAAVVESNFPGDQTDERLSHCVLVSADRITGVGRDAIYGKGRLNVLGAAQCRRLDQNQVAQTQ